MVFAAYVTLLARSGSWGGNVNFIGAVRGLNINDLALFSIGNLLVAITLHPLQFALIQAFEGFWGGSAIGRKIAVRHIMRHRNRATKLKDMAIERDAELKPEPGHPAYDETLEVQRPYANRSDASMEQVEMSFAAAEAWRLYASYPDDPESIMPTRLGNVLRRYEILAGKRYNLGTITTVPRLLQVADTRDVAYVQNQRMQMELALRAAFLALAATVLTLLFMWRHGPWLLLGLVPYTVAFASYRGSVVVAHEYGTALAVLIDLNRFALYERMHLPLPKDTNEEHEENAKLENVMRLDNVSIEKRLREPEFFVYVPPLVIPDGPQSGNKASPE